jgi:hypothetical protein
MTIRLGCLVREPSHARTLQLGLASSWPVASAIRTCTRAATAASLVAPCQLLVRAARRPDRAPAFLAPVERTVRTTGGDGARAVRDAGTGAQLLLLLLRPIPPQYTRDHGQGEGYY